MYSIVHETDEPTAVNLSCVGQLLPDAGKHLVTAGAKHLKIYRFNPYAIVQTDDNSFAQTIRLECLLSFNLMAPIRSLAVERLPMYPKADSILMTFDDAKLSIVNLNPKTMTLNTLSLHSMEDEFLRDGYTKDLFSPELRVDPNRRCAAFLVYGRHLAVVPFAEGREQLPQSYTIPLRNFDERLDNIIDMTFLDGYYEPTLLFLYEPIKTTAGRACVRYETAWILGVSLNVKDRVHSIVWNFGGMPTTVERCLRISSPINGVCLIGVNEIIYLNQSVPPCGIALNSCADEYVKFPLNNLKHLHLMLDGSVCEMIDRNHALLGLRSGDFYVLQFDVDQANAVKSLNLEKVFETSIPCTLTHCGPGYAFVGSRLGDSILLEYTRRVKQRIGGQPTPDDEDTDARPIGLSLCELQSADDEDKYLYQTDPATAVRRTTEFDFSFRVVDTISNVGPCKIIRGCAANNVGSLFRQRSPANLYFNIVSVSGHDKNSSLCFFERTIWPDVVTTSPLSDAVQFWSVGKRADGSHRYLLIAREINTLILELDNDMVEMDRPLFLSSETTVAAGDLADGEVSVQVTAMNIVMVGNDEQLQLVSIDSNFPVVSASIVDPFIVLLTQNGQILMYRLVTYPKIGLTLMPIATRLMHENSPVTAFCIYKDISGIVQPCTNEGPSVVHTGGERQPNIMPDPKLLLKKEEIDIKRAANDEIDELLYGDEEKRATLRQDKRHREAEEMDAEFDGDTVPIENNVHNPNHVMPTYWMCLTRETGHLYIYSMPEFQMVYMVKRFNLLPEILFDDVASALENDHATQQQQHASTNALLGLNPQHQQRSATAATDSAKLSTSSVIVRPEEVIMELQIFGTGMNQSRPILSALIDDTVVFYEMFVYDDIDEGYRGHLAVRFRRLKHSVVTRSSRFLGPNGRAMVESARDSERHRSLIHTFERVGNLTSGFFIAGNYPSLMFADRGEPRLHPMNVDGPIVSFTAFSNQNCPNGFLYLTKKERAMRIALLPTGMNYDAPYPYRKVGMLGAVHFVTYILQQNLFGVVISEKTRNLKQCIIVNEDKQFETLEREETFAPPMLNTYTLKLFSTEDWSFVPGTEFKFEEFEVVTCMEEILLSSESTVAGLKSYLAVGTALNYSEEVFVRGRVILCEIIEVVPEEGLPTSRHRLKVVYDKEQKGPVTSMCSCNGYLLTGMGQKVFIWQFRDGELNGVSFLDMHFYVHSLVGFRNLAVACDLYRSISLIRYQEQFKALSLVSRDLRPAAPPPMTANFLIDNKQVGFVLTDEAENITIFNYLPETKESMGGERLIIRAAINIGSLINSFVRVRGHVDDSFSDNAEQTRETQSCMFATLDGSFGVVRPLPEKAFRRLHMLQQVMTMQVPQPGGLHPRGSRAPRPSRTDTNQQLATARNIVDGNLVFQYLFLSTQEKTDFARKLGTSRYQIIDDLEEIRRVITHF